MTDGETAEFLHVVNQAEMRAGRLAQESGSSQQVKDFGKMLVGDHQTADLLVVDACRDSYLSLSRKELTADELRSLDALSKRLDRLAKLAGAKFDKAFAREMERDHQQVIDQLKGADLSLVNMRTLVAQLMPTLEHHRDEAARLLQPRLPVGRAPPRRRR